MAPNITTSPGATVMIPITVNNFTNISTLTLRIEFDNTVMNFNPGLSNFNPAFSGAFLGCSSAPDVGPNIYKVMVVWTESAPFNPLTLDNGSTIITLGFDYINGTTTLNFNSDYCEYTDQNLIVMNAIPVSTYYHNGQVSQTPNLVYPKLSLNTSSVNAGQGINITGTDYTKNNIATIYINGAGGFSQTINNIPTDATGGFTFNFLTNSTMPEGIYSVQVSDNSTGHTTCTKQFMLNVPFSDGLLLITYPITGVSHTSGESINVAWNDKMRLGANYSIVGSQRNYKYKIEYSTDGGTNWQFVAFKQGLAYNYSIVHLQHGVTIPFASNNALIRITDDFNPTNFNISPSFTVTLPATTNIKMDLQWDYSFPSSSSILQGIAADGAARIYLNLSKINSIGPNISSVSLVLRDNINTSYITLGKVKIASQTAIYSLEANGTTDTITVDNTANKPVYSFWYVAPDDFAGADPEDVYRAQRSVTARFTITYSNNKTEIFNKDIWIVRPPLALVHGLGGNPSTWDNFTYTSSSGPLKYLSQENNVLKEVKALEILPDVKFRTNAYNLVVPSNSQPLSKTLQGVIQEMRNQGYAANRVDYVGHSMGGCIIRLTTSLFSPAYKVTGSFADSPYKNYEMGFVHKNISLNTPHNGSPLANLATDVANNITGIIAKEFSEYYLENPNSIALSIIKPRGVFYNPYDRPVLSLLNKFEASPAVIDLQVNSGAYIAKTNIPSHLISGDVFGNTTTINSDVVNTIDNHFSYTSYLFYLWELKRILERDPYKKSQLNALKNQGSKAEIGIKFADLYANLYYKTPNFILNGDFVVPLGSQLAGLDPTTPIVNVYSGWFSNHMDVKDDLEVGNRVFQLLNSPVNGPLFGYIPETNYNYNNSKAFNPLPFDTIIFAIDTNKIKIRAPLMYSNNFVDSTLVISVMIKDTLHLQYVELGFQGESYYSDSISPTINLAL